MACRLHSHDPVCRDVVHLANPGDCSGRHAQRVAQRPVLHSRGRLGEHDLQRERVLPVMLIGQIRETRRQRRCHHRHRRPGRDGGVHALGERAPVPGAHRPGMIAGMSALEADRNVLCQDRAHRHLPEVGAAVDFAGEQRPRSGHKDGAVDEIQSFEIDRLAERDPEPELLSDVRFGHLQEFRGQLAPGFVRTKAAQVHVLRVGAVLQPHARVVALVQPGRRGPLGAPHLVEPGLRPPILRLRQHTHAEVATRDDLAGVVSHHLAGELRRDVAHDLEFSGFVGRGALTHRCCRPW